MSQQNQISEKKIILPPWLKPNLGYERVSFSSTSSTFLKRIQSVPINQPVRLISGTSNTTPSSHNCRETIKKNSSDVCDGETCDAPRPNTTPRRPVRYKRPVLPLSSLLRVKCIKNHVHNSPSNNNSNKQQKKSYNNNNKCNNHQPSPKTTTSCSTSTSKQQT